MKLLRTVIANINTGVKAYWYELNIKEFENKFKELKEQITNYPEYSRFSNGYDVRIWKSKEFEFMRFQDGTLLFIQFK